MSERVPKKLSERISHLKLIAQRRGELRKQGYSFVGDYLNFGIVVECQKCGHRCDLENVVIAHNKELIKLACPMCMYQGLNIIDER